MFSVVLIDHQRLLELTERVAAGAQDHGELVRPWRGIELVFVVIRCPGEVLPFILLEVHVHGVAKSRADGPIRPVSDAQDVQVRVILSFFLVELDRIRGKLHRQVHARRIRRGIKVRCLERSMNGSGLGARRARFELLFERLAFQYVCRPGIAVTAARARRAQSAAIQLHFYRVAAAFRRVRRHVSQNVKFILLPTDALQAAEQIVGIEDRESACSFREGSKNLLIRRSRSWKLRHDRSRPVKRRVVVIGTGIEAPAAGASASSAAGPTPGATTRSARAARTAASAPTTSSSGAAPSSSSTTPAASASTPGTATTCPTASAPATASPATTRSATSGTAAARPLRIRHGTRRKRRQQNPRPRGSPAIRWPIRNRVRLACRRISTRTSAGDRRSQSACIERIHRDV